MHNVGIVINQLSKQTHSVDSIPETTARIEAVTRALKESETYKRLEEIEIAEASESDILRAHSLSYLNAFRQASCTSQNVIRYPKVELALDPRTSALIQHYHGGSSNFEDTGAKMLATIRRNSLADTPIVESTFRAALLSAGSVLSAIKRVEEGGPTRVFCLTRPPGHHAEYDTAMGFCFFNNIAVGANYLLEKSAANRVAILDFDVHHGNGTQHLFYHDPRVLVINIHRDTKLDNFYPGFCGHASEVGAEKGLGYNLNIPLKAGSSSQAFSDAFTYAIKRLGEFKPEWLLVSAGFDAHKDDPLGGMELRSKDYRKFGQRLAEVADTYCNGRIISTLEGGYNLNALSSSVIEYIDGLAT